MFELFGIAHISGIVMTMIWAVALNYTSYRYNRLNIYIEFFSGLLVLSFYPIFAYFRLQEVSFDVRYHLPLQISSVILFALGIALLTKNRFAYAITMFWALPGGIASILFPDITNTFPHIDYIFFWTSHSVLIGYVVYLMRVRNIDLGYFDALKALGLFIAYIVLVYPLNTSLGSNYGYLNSPPDSIRLPSFLENPSIYIPILVIIMGTLSIIVLSLHKQLYSNSKLA